MTGNRTYRARGVEFLRRFEWAKKGALVLPQALALLLFSSQALAYNVTISGSNTGGGGGGSGWAWLSVLFGLLLMRRRR